MNSLLLNTIYFPPTTYFSAIYASQTFFIEQFENFGKQSYRNRCEIMSANGVIPLTIPVVKANSKKLVKDLKIAYATPWQKLHFRGIESAYKNSPYYEYYIDDLMPFFEKKETYLLDLNNAILEVMLNLLKLDHAIQVTKDYIHKGDEDFVDLRNAFHPKINHRQGELNFPIQEYRQTFSDRFSFAPNLSVLDLIFCCGPEAIDKISIHPIL